MNAPSGQASPPGEPASDTLTRRKFAALLLAVIWRSPLLAGLTAFAIGLLIGTIIQAIR